MKTNLNKQIMETQEFRYTRNSSQRFQDSEKQEGSSFHRGELLIERVELCL